MPGEGPDRGKRPSPFKPWQWVEIWILILVIAAQLVLHLAIESLIASALVGLVALALIVHCYSWMIPLLRERRRGQRH